MNSESSKFSQKIKCHSSKQVFCQGDLCFIEYTEITSSKTEYGCIELDESIDRLCNKTIDLIHRECCSTTFCNSRLVNHDHRWSILNASAVNDNDLFHIRLQIVLNMIMAIVLFGLLCVIMIYLWKQRIERLCKHIGQRTIKARKLQPSLSPPIHISAPQVPSFIEGKTSSNNINHISPCSPTPSLSFEEYSNQPLPTLICHNDNRPSDII